MRTLNRLEVIGETMRAALNGLAAAAPDWLLRHSSPEWFERYGVRVDAYRLPRSEAGRAALAEAIGRDGHDLLAALDVADARLELRTLPAVEILRHVWIQQFYLEDGRVRWRPPADQPPPSRRLHSPYDREAVCGSKRGQTWIGYKVHLTETCDPDAPHVIVAVQTTPAGTAASAMTAAIHRVLVERGLVPARHLVDSGYIDAGLLVTSQAEHQIELMGPARPDTSWHGRAGQGFDVTAFTLDWAAHVARCPEGQTSVRWREFAQPLRGITVRIAFDRRTCQACVSRARCTQARAGPRTLSLLPQAAHEAAQRRRQEQEREAWQQSYARRAGVEGTLSQGIRTFGLRRCRYIGLAKAHLQHVLTAVAINLVRLDAWLRGEPSAPTRISRFAQLKTVLA